MITIGDINLIFTTLWSRISPQRELLIKSHLSDFSVIKIDGEDFRPLHYNRLHSESLEFLCQELENRQKGKNVIVTHHVPTMLNYSEEYKTSPINEAFVVELHDLIEKYQPEAWIYGHSHYYAPEFTIGKTQMLTNQLGYVEMGEHKSFRLDAVVNI